jgi:hypothetical protein
MRVPLVHKREEELVLINESGCVLFSYKFINIFPFMESIAGTWEIVCCNNASHQEFITEFLSTWCLKKITVTLIACEAVK